MSSQWAFSHLKKIIGLAIVIAGVAAIVLYLLRRFPAA